MIPGETHAEIYWSGNIISLMNVFLKWKYIYTINLHWSKNLLQKRSITKLHPCYCISHSKVLSRIICEIRLSRNQRARKAVSDSLDVCVKVSSVSLNGSLDKLLGLRASSFKRYFIPPCRKIKLADVFREIISNGSPLGTP